MITLVEDKKLVLPVSKYGIFALKQYSQIETYKDQPYILQVWIQTGKAGKRLSVVSHLSGRLTVSAQMAAMTANDWTELREFLLNVGGSVVEGELPLLHRLFPFSSSESEVGFEGGPIMHLPFEAAERICASPFFMTPLHPETKRVGEPILKEIRAFLAFQPADSLSEVFRLLCNCDSNFKENINYGAWITELSHKCRHGLASCYVIKLNGQAIATASVLFQGQRVALLGLLGCDPSLRGKGWGKHMLVSVCDCAFKQGLQPWLLAASHDLDHYYQQLGWQITGEWGAWALDCVCQLKNKE